MLRLQLGIEAFPSSAFMMVCVGGSILAQVPCILWW